MAIDLDAPLRFLGTAFRPDDWIAVLLKSHETGGTAQRVGPLSLITHPRFQAWLRAQSARRFSVFVSVNAIRPQRKARTRDAIGEIRHVFLDADRDGQSVLTAIASRRDLPSPSYVVHSSPNRLHVLWQVSGFTREDVEALQKQLARELTTDKAATSCAQMTRLPGFFYLKSTVVETCGTTMRLQGVEYAAVTHSPNDEAIHRPSSLSSSASSFVCRVKVGGAKSGSRTLSVSSG